MNRINRRSFMKRATAVAAGVVGSPYIVPSSVFGAAAPSNRIAMGFIGVGGQGTGNMKNLIRYDDCQGVAVCDVVDSHKERARNEVNKKYGNKDCKVFGDFRKLLAMKDIDAVTVCTPDHWHGLISIAAAKAGKDIYCEKPLVNNIAEGKALVKTVKRYGRVLQTGSHERSREGARFACELVRNGRIGKLQSMVVNLPCTQSHHLTIINDRAEHQPMPVPAGLDWDMWMGPTPNVPFTEGRYTPLGWRFILDYGGGEMSDRGAHVIDLAQLGNNSDKTTPVEYIARGTRPKSKLYNAFFDYDFECKYADGMTIKGTHDEPRGIKYIGDEGWVFVHIHGGHLEASKPSLLKEKIGHDEILLGRSPGHHRNFLNCVKTREEPMAPYYVGHNTATICHLLTISMQLGGARLKWDPKREVITNNDQANNMISRPMRSPWRL